MRIRMTKEAIELKKGQIEKKIWGHRLYDEQTGMMTLLEFLCVLSSRKFEEQTEDSLILSDSNRRLKSYKAPKHILLRSLIFNNPYINENFRSNQDCWESWHNKFCADANNKKVFPEGSVNIDLDALKEIFGYDDGPEKAFEGFSHIVNSIRQAGINVESGKRWTSRFVFPWGRNCLFLDLSEKGEIGDRRFFGRAGELLFLMLSFAEKRKELSRLIKEKLLDCESVFDTVCKTISSIQKEDMCEIKPKQGNECELPIDFFEDSRDRINILCEDLIQAFSLPIPTPDIVNHASRLISLNLFCYFLEQSQAVLNKYQSEKDSGPIVILCEALQKENSSIRNASKELFKIHAQMSLQAVSAYFDSKKSGRNSEVSNQESLQSEEEKPSRECDSLTAICTTHKKHWGASLHRFLSKDCGLASKLCTREYRYAPSDDLIETLTAVLIPKKRLLRKKFLAELYKRYHIVFGEDELSEVTLKNKRRPDKNELEKNRKRLQNRLQSLGRLVSLSDGFEYVLNPYRSLSEEGEAR